MLIEENISLKKYNTFGLDYKARWMVHLEKEEEAGGILNNSSIPHGPVLVLGGGSNILFKSDYEGVIMHPEFGGVKVEDEHDGIVSVAAGAGITWDNFVNWAVEKGLFGVENLSLIPGDTGAVPVQNIGAYGAEVKDVIDYVDTVSLTDGSFRRFSSAECVFGYRSSVFKMPEKGKHLVTCVHFRLLKNGSFRLDYGNLKEEVGKLGKLTLRNVRQAVINIRSRKLPDPSVSGNAGSFFKNPVIGDKLASELKLVFPDMPVYGDTPGFTKIPAGWLIEKCGWKGKRYGNVAVYEKQALVLINCGNASGTEIFDLSERIRESVKSRFGIGIEREVEVL